MAATMMPMPPTHWMMARQSSRPRGRSSRPVRTVAPVVVMPEMVSKEASVMLMPEATKGMAAMAGRKTQAMTVSRKASRWPVRWSPPRERIQRQAPMKMEPKADTAKTCDSGRLSAKSINAHGIIAAPSRTVMMPMARKMGRSCILRAEDTLQILRRRQFS